MDGTTGPTGHLLEELKVATTNDTMDNFCRPFAKEGANGPEPEYITQAGFGRPHSSNCSNSGSICALADPIIRHCSMRDLLVSWYVLDS